MVSMKEESAGRRPVASVQDHGERQQARIQRRGWPKRGKDSNPWSFTPGLVGREFYIEQWPLPQ